MPKMSTSEYKAYLLAKIEKARGDGLSLENALETAITPHQYDWLVDHDVDFDAELVGLERIAEEKAAARKERGRRLSPNGYNKKYPADKQVLYNGLVEFLATQGAEIAPPEKVNYRDIDFIISGKRFHIVLSNPRK